MATPMHNVKKLWIIYIGHEWMFRAHVVQEPSMDNMNDAQ